MHQVFSPKTEAERNVKSVVFLPSVIPVPKVTTDDFLRQAATDIVTILTNPDTSTNFSLESGDTTHIALLKIAKTLHRAENLPTSIPPTSITPALPRVQPNPIMPASPRVQLPKKQIPSSPLIVKDQTWTKNDDVNQQQRYNLRRRCVTNYGTNF